MKEFSDGEEIGRHVHDLLAKVEAPQHEGEHQIVLAHELFTRDHPSEAISIGDRDFENNMMQYWITNGYASAFRKLIEHTNFSRHYRFNKDPLNVTLSDVEYFLHNNAVPEW